MNDSINIGVSTCLSGENVCYSGNHSKKCFLTEMLGCVERIEIYNKKTFNSKVRVGL